MRDFMVGLVERSHDEVTVRSQPGRVIEVVTLTGKILLWPEQAEALVTHLAEAAENARRSVDE